MNNTDLYDTQFRGDILKQIEIYLHILSNGYVRPAFLKLDGCKWSSLASSPVYFFTSVLPANIIYFQAFCEWFYKHNKGIQTPVIQHPKFQNPYWRLFSPQYPVSQYTICSPYYFIILITILLKLLLFRDCIIFSNDFLTTMALKYV